MIRGDTPCLASWKNIFKTAMFVQCPAIKVSQNTGGSYRAGIPEPRFSRSMIPHGVTSEMKSSKANLGKDWDFDDFSVPYLHENMRRHQRFYRWNTSACQTPGSTQFTMCMFYPQLGDEGLRDHFSHLEMSEHACFVPHQVMEALKILKGGVPIGEACRYTYCLREPTRKGLFLQPTPLEKPARTCFVCNTNTVRTYVRRSTGYGIVYQE